MSNMEKRYKEAKTLLYGSEHDKAVPLLEALAEEGHAEAQGDLGYFYRYGDRSGANKDYAKAFAWLTKAAEQGEATSQRLLGDCYYKGEGVQQDYAKAFKWYTKAANGGDNYTDEPLGKCYLLGRGVQANEDKALELLNKKYSSGEMEWRVGDLYCEAGDGEQCKAKAIEWYTKAAERNNHKAMRRLLELLEYCSTAQRNEIQTKIDRLRRDEAEGYARLRADHGG